MGEGQCQQARECLSTGGRDQEIRGSMEMPQKAVVVLLSHCFYMPRGGVVAMKPVGVDGIESGTMYPIVHFRVGDSEIDRLDEYVSAVVEMARRPGILVFPSFTNLWRRLEEHGVTFCLVHPSRVWLRDREEQRIRSSTCSTHSGCITRAGNEQWAWLISCCEEQAGKRPTYALDCQSDLDHHLLFRMVQDAGCGAEAPSVLQWVETEQVCEVRAIE